LLAFPFLIDRLRSWKMGQHIREEGPAAHLGKAGTPTAGGVLFLLIGALLYVPFDRSRAGLLVLLALLSGGVLGFLDDWRAIRGGRNLGLRAREKLFVQILTGAVLGAIGVMLGFDLQLVPFGAGAHLGWWMVPLGAIAFTAGTNAFNLTDGSDGLAGGTGVVAFLALGLLAYWSGRAPAATEPLVLAGSLAGFLFYNIFPARVFMGDTGSLGMGNALVAAAIVTGFLWYLPLLGLTFVIETLSVIIQVASFKLTGRRVFKMSPLHHHFHLKGWPETRVALAFWGVAIVGAVLSLALAAPGAFKL
jgi:phospho-N-acetylmuramoyl-pentapeptide-transferase